MFGSPLFGGSYFGELWRRITGTRLPDNIIEATVSVTNVARRVTVASVARRLSVVSRTRAVSVAAVTRSVGVTERRRSVTFDG